MFDPVIRKCPQSQRRKPRREAVFDSNKKKEELSQKRLFQAESLFDSAIRKCPWSQN